MALFKDPIQSVTFELPDGWAYDMLYSTLTDFFFTRWDRPEEMLIVHLRRAAVDRSFSDDRWLEKIQIEVGGQTVLFDIDTPGGRAVAADFVTKEGLTQRVAFKRGYFVDIAVEQRNADREAPEPWQSLDRVIRTAVSAANTPQPGTRSSEEFNKTIEAANEAFERKDYSKVVDFLQDAIRIGANAWIFSLTSSAGAPEITAAVRVAQAMVHLGHFNGDPFLARDAATVLRRSLCSLESAGKGAVDESRELVDEMKEVLESIQSELLGNSDPDATHDSAPIISIRERGFRMAQAAAAAFDAADCESASLYAGAAVEDFLFLLAYFRRGRSQEIPDVLVKHLADQGISDHEEQRDAIQKAREGVLFPALNLSLQIRYCCAMQQKDPEAAMEAAGLCLPLARLIAAGNAGETSISLNLVLALMNKAGAIAACRNGDNLQEAMQCVEEASRILDATGEGKCPADGWVRNYKPQTESSLQALNRWLEAAEAGGDTGPASDLRPLISKFEDASGRLRGKITPAAEGMEDTGSR